MTFQKALFYLGSLAFLAIYKYSLCIRLKKGLSLIQKKYRIVAYANKIINCLRIWQINERKFVGVPCYWVCIWKVLIFRLTSM